jgi:vacuolar-type H+-ATPase subunit I/STV1
VITTGRWKTWNALILLTTHKIKTMSTETRPLYLIQQDHLTLLRMLEDAGGDLTPELEQALQITEQELEVKAVNYARVCLALDSKVKSIDDEIKRLQDRKKKFEKSGEMLEERLKGAMDQFGLQRLESDLISLSFRKSESVEVFSPEVVPEQYYETKKEISKSKIRAAMKEGCIVAGARLVTKQNLQIK